MTKIIEVPDVAQWEETDSELAKYTIGKLQEELKITQEKWEQDKQFYRHRLEENIDYRNRINKAIEYIINETTYSACDEMDKLLDILRGE